MLKAYESVEHMKNCTTVDAAVDFHVVFTSSNIKNVLVFSQKKHGNNTADPVF